MKEKVNVTGVPETMVQTLYARAKETKKKNAKINDEIAVELVKKLDYDYSKADKDNAMTYGVIASFYAECVFRVRLFVKGGIKTVFQGRCI